MRRSPLILLVVLAIALTACSKQEAEIPVNARVPGEFALAEDAEEGGGEDAVEAVPFADADAQWVAEQLAFIETPASMPAGEVTLGLQIIGGLPHNVVFEGFEGDRLLVEGPGEGEFTGGANIPAGEYTFYCAIAGHRAAGMEGTITVG